MLKKNGVSSNKMVEIIKSAVSVKSTREFFAFQRKVEKSTEEGWKVSNPHKEYQRQLHRVEVGTYKV